MIKKCCRYFLFVISMTCKKVLLKHMELKILLCDFKGNSNHAMLISEFTEAEFKDNKPTKMFVVIKRSLLFRGRIYGYSVAVGI